MYRTPALSVGTIEPPPMRASHESHPRSSSIAGGAVRSATFPAKQSPPAAGAPSARSASPDARTTLSRTSFPLVTHRLRSRFGSTAMPYRSWFSTRLPVMRLPEPPVTRMPVPKVG